MERRPSTWFRSARPNPNARVRLVCFAHAGGAASLFHTWWRLLPGQVEVHAAQLPGREERHREPCYRQMGPLVEALLPALQPLADKPLALLGHSMGALIALELARGLRRQNAPAPVHLFVAGRRAPQIPDPLPPTYGLPEAELVRQLRERYRGMPEVIVEDPELRAIYLPILRADLELTETYRPAPEAPLDCPISVFGGRDDVIPEEDLAAWGRHTTAPCKLTMVDGHHFFLKTSPEQVLPLVADDLLHSLHRAEQAS